MYVQNKLNEIDIHLKISPKKVKTKSHPPRRGIEPRSPA